MAAKTDYSERRNSNTQLLEELEALSQSLYQTNPSTTRRTASLALPRTSVPSLTDGDDVNVPGKVEEKPVNRPRTRRLSLSPWRSRPKHEGNDESDQQRGRQAKASNQSKLEEKSVSSEKKGIWNWKPIRALSHIGMQKLSILFSVEVVAVQGLPASMNGLRLSVGVRKKESKDGGVHTMPSRVSQGAADFEETLFVRCHVYCTYGGQDKQLKFEPRPFLVYVFAVDAVELDFGRNSVDLSLMIRESVEKNSQGVRVRQWDTSFNLSGKAKGGELVLKLGFQVMEKEGGIDIYNQAEGLNSFKKNFSPSFRRKQSQTSFSVPSPKMSGRAEAWSPSQKKAAAELQGLDELNLDEPDKILPSSSSLQKSGEAEAKMEDLDLPDFEVVDKGVEIQDKVETNEKESEENVEVKSFSSEVVKEMVHDHLHLTRLAELHSIAQQIKALESMLGEEKIVKADDDAESQRLDAEEETVTREFLQMLEHEDSKRYKFNQPEIPPLKLEGADDSAAEAESNLYLSDLGKGLGCVVQTRDGGYLASMNPLDTLVSRKDTPKLAMQLSKLFVIPSQTSTSGFELFQRMAAIGFEELSSQIFSLMPVEELMGKTAEQIAFEGIASAIIQGRNREGASSSAARTIAAVKTMCSVMTSGRKDRVQTGLWNVDEKPLPADELLGFSLQKIETMAVEALKIEAEMVEEDAPFDVSPVGGKTEHPLTSAIPLDNWIKKHGLVTSDSEPGPSTITIAAVVQLRDPIRRYEAVGGPVIALIFATQSETKEDKYDEEKKFRVTSLHVGGLKLRTGGAKKNVWDSERQRLTAMQWLVAYGLGKGAKKGKHPLTKGQDLLWSISSRIMADMWLKPMRNPDVKFTR